MEIIIPIILTIICVAGLAIKILLKKNGEFSGTCSSNNPFLKKKEPCQFCGAQPDEKCQKD
tara:strand:- start:329 stop:511 length:183 start_codon:yes stop_codon:yes gene_type:complete